MQHTLQPQRFKYRYIRKRFIMRGILTISLVISFFFVSCRKEKATWSSSWTAPLVKDTLRITDYVNDSTLGVNADQSIQVILERDLVDFDISDLLVIPDTSIEQSFSIGVSNLNLSPGTTFIDDIQEHTFSLDGAALREARISSGKAEVTIVNPISEGGIFEVELPGVTKNGNTFTQSEFVDGGSNGNPTTKTFNLDLAGYTIDMTGENGLSYNILQSKMTVTTDPNGSSVNVTDQDVFEFIVAFSGLKVEYGKGYFGQRSFSDTTTIDLEALNAIAGGNINIENVNFDIILYNGVKAPAQGVITQLISTNYNEDQVQLNHPDFNQTLNINPAQWDWVDLTFSERTLSFDQSTSNIIPFIENLGKEYKLGYELELNPYGNASQGNNELFPQSSIGAKIKADFPLVLSSNQLKLRDTFEFSYEDKERFLEVEEGSFILSTNNTFPYGGSIQLRLLDENYNELAILEQDEPVQPAPLNTSTDSHILQSQETEILIKQEDVQVLKDVNHIELEVVFDSATNSNNVVYENAAIDFLLRANFKLRTNL